MKQRTTGIIYMVFTFLFILALFPTCKKTADPAIDSPNAAHSPFLTFRDIPGVMEWEVTAIETLQKENRAFVYGMTITTEAFIKENGEIGGYSTLFCEWLTKLFGIRFQPEVYAWNDLLDKLNSGDVDFTGTLTISEERKLMYYMTDTIAERQYKMVRINGSPALDRIALERPPSYAFLEDAVHSQGIASVMAPDSYIPVWVNDYTEVYDVLERGDADAFISENTMEASFSAYDNIYIEDFLPLVFSPISMATAKPELQPIISVVTRAIRNGILPYLNHLYNQGYQDYMKYKMSIQLSDKELDYIASHPIIPVVANYDNFPVCFYNTREGEWQGIFFDLLDKITAVTGLSFNLINENDSDWPVIYEMVRSGQASLIADLTWTQERANYFIWPESGPLPDYLALVSKLDYRDITINEIRNTRVGVARGTVYASNFRQWFPEHPQIIEYDNMVLAIAALGRDEVDLVMSSQRRLMYVTHYLELPGYKTNIIFDQPLQTLFGVNGNEAALCSIIDKALKVIDTNGISEHWMRRTFDYRAKVAEARMPWLIGATAMTLITLSLVVIMFLRHFNLRKLKRAETEAMEADELAHIMFTTAPFASCMFDKDFNMIDCNQEVVKIFGIPDKEFFLTRHPELFPEYQPSGELSAEVSAQNVRIAMEKGYHHFECMHRKFTGTPLPVESTLVRVKYKGNYVIAAYFRDLTEQKAMAQLEKQHAQAEAANHAKSAFLATMSHEMRTPMNAILGITEIILRNETLPSNLQESLYKIYDSSNLLLNIINDILDLSKIEAGKLEILPARYETASMINDTVTLNVMRIGSKPIEFRLSVDENLPAYLFGDELRIRQILNNVLSNAIKYTPKGEVKLSVFAEKENETVLTSEGTVSTEGLNLLCIVSDTGQGMSKEQVSSLFDEYSRFNTKANRTTEGTGLGMSITYNLVRMMNGHISVESELDKGTIVTVRLPQGNVSAGVIGRELAENLAKFEKSAIKQIKKAQIDYDLMPYGSVLLVDDVESNIFVARGLMFPYELSIESVLSGFEAIEKIREGKTYDIVFMDHMMPRMDGIETTQKLREMGYAQPIVALTANAIVGQSNIFMENGFDGFISKPIDIRQLNAMLKKFIRDKQPPEVIEAANRNKVNQVNLTNEIEHMGINPKLEEIFIRDASRLAKTLEEIQKNGIYEDEDIRLYIVSVHALKSALANVHEMNLSELAFMLEKAGREKNTAVMSAETKSFLDSLWAVIKKHTLHKEHSEGEETVNQQIIVEDRAYLQEKLQVIKNACEVYDRKAIKAAIADLQEKEWNALTKKLIATMDEELLNGDFEAIAKRAEEGVGMKNEK